MNRRALLSTVLGKTQKKPEEQPRPFFPRGGLSPFSGEWTIQKAAHLLRRGMFGPNYEQIRWAKDAGMEAVVEKLFEDIPLPEPPVNTHYKNDPWVPLGATWVTAPYKQSILSQQMSYRTKSLESWTMKLVIEEGISAREKLTLFWHNHFPMNAVLDPKFLFRYIDLLRRYAWGNFRELTKAITIEPAMLEYLNGNQNAKFAPNENYGRELLELFTIGKGPLIGPGDYTNYTEHDVREVARVLTGWKDFGGTTDRPDGVTGSMFIKERHDTGTKTLSKHFDQHVITDMGDKEYAYLIDVIFQQREVARFISRKLYRWFVYYQIDETVESEVIEPMAQLLIDNDYVIKPVLKALLSSEHFYSADYFGAVIKSPMDYVASVYKPLGVKISETPDQQTDSFYALYKTIVDQQQEYYFVPEVAGWRAYYVAPLFYRSWLNSSSLPSRMNFVKWLSLEEIRPFEANGPGMRIDVLSMIKTLEKPLDPNSLIDELALILFAFPLSEEQRSALKEVLIPGLPDFEWTAEYGAHLENPGNRELAKAVEGKLRALFHSMLSMAEFQLA